MLLSPHVRVSDVIRITPESILSHCHLSRLAPCPFTFPLPFLCHPERSPRSEGSRALARLLPAGAERRSVRRDSSLPQPPLRMTRVRGESGSKTCYSNHAGVSRALASL